ncbi:MAG: hypothetical protein JRN15_08010 [Nitrososphaerota archaeon]|nr:hypothetical protein [Nitrososphaerota archaeon]
MANGRRSYRRTILVRRRGYTNRFGRKVKPTKFREEDRGKPGHGSPIVTNLKKDSMNVVAREMGYSSATAVPEMHIDSYIRKLVNRYGERSTRGKIQLMINDRKGTRSEAKRKFEMMIASLDKQYEGNGWTPAA